MKTRKFDYLTIVQGNYGQGWEDLSEYKSSREARKDLREYRISAPEYAHRTISRRVPADVAGDFSADRS